MKIILSLLLTMYTSLIMNAQDILRIHYDSFVRDVEENPYPNQENRVLEISDSCSAFFWIDVSEDGIPFMHELFPFSVYKHYPAKDDVTFLAGVSTFTYYYTEKMPDFDWNLLPGDTTICSYPCHKAQTNYRGRTWTAWYAEDLPYNDGPWKLCGLPGLILKAVDSHGDFAFTAIGISKTQAMGVKMSLKGCVKSTRQHYMDDLREYRRDSEEFFNSTHGTKIHQIFSEGQARPQPQTPCFLEYE